MSSTTETNTLDTSPNITISLTRGSLTLTFNARTALTVNDFNTIRENLAHGRDVDFYAVITTRPLRDCDAAPAHDRLLICSIPDRKIRRNGTTADIADECTDPVPDLIYAALKTINDNDPITPDGAKFLTFLCPQNQLPSSDQNAPDQPQPAEFSFIRFHLDGTTFNFVLVHDHDPSLAPDASITQSIPEALEPLKDSQTDIIVIRTRRPFASLNPLIPDLLETLQQIAPARHAISSTADQTFLDFDEHLHKCRPSPDHTQAAQPFGTAAETLARRAAEYQEITTYFRNPLTPHQANALARLEFAPRLAAIHSPTITSHFEA